MYSRLNVNTLMISPSKVSAIICKIISISTAQLQIIQPAYQIPTLQPLRLASLLIARAQHSHTDHFELASTGRSRDNKNAVANCNHKNEYLNVQQKSALFPSLRVPAPGLCRKRSQIQEEKRNAARP